MKGLVYYALGFSPTYIHLTKLSIETLLHSGWAGDVLVICDESMIDTCRDVLHPSVRYMSVPNSSSPVDASMHKLNIFDYPDIDAYDAVLFIDSDTVVHLNVGGLFEQALRRDVLYCYTESNDPKAHAEIFWSLKSYTDDELAAFETNGTHVFNAGCFLSAVSHEMKQHFAAVNSMVRTHVGKYFYEQSFMNVYFNTIGKTDRSLLTIHSYTMWPKDQAYPGTIVHFCGEPGDGVPKLERMKRYVATYLPESHTTHTRPAPLRRSTGWLSNRIHRRLA